MTPNPFKLPKALEDCQRMLAAVLEAQGGTVIVPPQIRERAMTQPAVISCFQSPNATELVVQVKWDG